MNESAHLRWYPGLLKKSAQPGSCALSSRGFRMRSRRERKRGGVQGIPLTPRQELRPWPPPAEQVEVSGCCIKGKILATELQVLRFIHQSQTVQKPHSEPGRIK